MDRVCAEQQHVHIASVICTQVINTMVHGHGVCKQQHV